MNVFFIPSWYPSVTDPLPGVFFREQALALARHYDDIKIGISTWGQNDDRLLLWGREPVKSGLKFLFRNKPKPYVSSLINKKVFEFYKPTFTWSSKIFGGNLQQIIKANLINFDAFQNQAGRADIIHAHIGYPAGYIAKLISERECVPYIITEQMSPFPHKHFHDNNGELISKLSDAYKSCGKNIVISKALASKMKRHNLQNITVIPNLVDEDFFMPAEKEKTNATFTFFSLGRMVPQKGIDILLKAFALFQSDAQLRIGGDGSHLLKYKHLARELNIKEKVSWLGQLDKTQILKEFQSCDAFVLPSRHESMGVVFAEAMACGKPVIATICGGPEEFIDDINGYLVMTEDVGGLRKAMIKMEKNHGKFDPILIRKRFEERFSSKVITSKIREIYEHVIQKYSHK